jgi:trigger factor
MTHKVIEKKQGELKLEIEVAKESLEKATQIVAEDLAKSVKISGFRPGKAPIFMIEREVGKDRFWAEVIDKVVPEAYYEALLAEKVSPIAQPRVSIKTFVPGEQLVFEAEIAILPEIPNFKYTDLKIKEEKPSLSKKDEDEAMEVLLKRSATEKEVERPAKMEDRVEIDFTGTIKGLPFEGGESKNHPVVLGSNTLIPGFEEKIVGKKAGEEFDFDIEFPKDYHAKNLAGQKTNFKVKLNKVYESQVPTASDEWAKTIGFEDLKKLKEEVKNQLQTEKELEAKRKTEEKLMTTIVEKNKIEAPSVLVAEEVHKMVHEAEHNLSHSGLTMDKFLEMTNKTMAEIEEEMKPEAENRTKIGMVLGEVARAEKLEVKDKEIEEEIERLMQMASPDVSKDDIKAFYEEPNRKRDIANQLIVKKVLKFLWEKNVINS